MHLEMVLDNSPTHPGGRTIHNLTLSSFLSFVANCPFFHFKFNNITQCQISRRYYIGCTYTIPFLILSNTYLIIIQINKYLVSQFQYILHGYITFPVTFLSLIIIKQIWKLERKHSLVYSRY